MSVTVKVFLEKASGSNEIRRFLINTSAGNDFFTTTREKIRQLYPVLANRKFTLYWQDPDGDRVVFSSLEEMRDALNYVTDGVFRVYISEPVETSETPDPQNQKKSSERQQPQSHQPNNSQPSGFSQSQPQGPSQSQPEGPQASSRHSGRTNDDQPLHPGIRCNGCGGPVKGIRYKCCVCPDFNLCQTCEGKGVHSEHDIFKINHPHPFFQNHPGFFHQTGFSQNLPGFSQNLPGFSQNLPGFSQNLPGFSQNLPGFSQNLPGFSQNLPGFFHQPGFSQNPPGFSQNPPGFSQNPPGFSQHQPGFSQHHPGFSQHHPGFSQHPPGFSASSTHTGTGASFSSTCGSNPGMFGGANFHASANTNQKDKKSDKPWFEELFSQIGSNFSAFLDPFGFKVSYDISDGTGSHQRESYHHNCCPMAGSCPASEHMFRRARQNCTTKECQAGAASKDGKTRRWDAGPRTRAPDSADGSVPKEAGVNAERSNDQTDVPENVSVLRIPTSIPIPMPGPTSNSTSTEQQGSKPQTNLYPNLQVQQSLEQMLSMGFSNTDGWLTALLTEHGGNIVTTINAIMAKATQQLNHLHRGR